MSVLPVVGPGAIVIGSIAFGGPKKSSHRKFPRAWADVCGPLCQVERMLEPCSRRHRCPGSDIILTAPKASSGPAAEGYAVEFLGLWNREVELDITPPPPPPVFPNPGPGPPGPGAVVRGTVLL